MFGMEQMIKQMLADAGIDIETLSREVMTAYQEARQYSARIVQSQSDIVELLKVGFQQQKENAIKLDAIMKHLNISLTNEDGDNGPKQLTIDGPAIESGKPN